MSSIVQTPTVWTSLQNFFPAEKHWVLGRFQSHAFEYVSFIYQLSKNLISS